MSPYCLMERVMRIELTPSAWKAEVLPLNYTRIIDLLFKQVNGCLERKTRFELATLALARRCSTPEPLPHTYYKIIGRGWWIRTTESSANGFTVRPLWPLGNPSKLYWSWWRESNPQPADYKSAALPAELYPCIVAEKMGFEPMRPLRTLTI